MDYEQSWYIWYTVVKYSHEKHFNNALHSLGLHETSLSTPLLFLHALSIPAVRMLLRL